MFFVGTSPCSHAPLAYTPATDLHSPPAHKHRLLLGYTMEQIQPTSGIFILSGSTYTGSQDK